MEPIDLKLPEIKTVICHLLPDAEVFLFGSRARGDDRCDSDYDLLVIVRTPLDNQ